MSTTVFFWKFIPGKPGHDIIAAQKNYVLDAPLGDRPIVGADAYVMNVRQARYYDYLIV